MSIEHLAYISTAAPDLTDADLRLILDQSRRNNPRQRITGHLQCHGDLFFQVLEGPAESLDALLEKVGNDPRHADLRLLYRETLTRRNFANWSMGFGPCGRGQPLTGAGRRLLGLRDGGPCGARRALGLFLSLLDASG
ncbi:MAG: BLUF domain-containing protein [Thiobacillaceae bacterium]|jgi:hypothetical protein|nr:BLUF domain-containing protein [Thiobacillaceae bacterium]